MKTNLLKMAAVFMAVATMTACSKDSKKSNTELLTKAAWKYQIAGPDMNKDGVVGGESPLIEGCSKDDFAVFSTNGTGTWDEGASKCDPDDPQSSSFTWQLKNGDKELEFDGDTWTILSIDDNNLKIYIDDNSTGMNIRGLFILKH